MVGAIVLDDLGSADLRDPSRCRKPSNNDRPSPQLPNPPLPHTKAVEVLPLMTMRDSRGRFVSDPILLKRSEQVHAELGRPADRTRKVAGVLGWFMGLGLIGAIVLAAWLATHG